MARAGGLNLKLAGPDLLCNPESDALRKDAPVRISAQVYPSAACLCSSGLRRCFRLLRATRANAALSPETTPGAAPSTGSLPIPLAASSSIAQHGAPLRYSVRVPRARSRYRPPCPGPMVHWVVRARIRPSRATGTLGRPHGRSERPIPCAAGGWQPASPSASQTVALRPVVSIEPQRPRGWAAAARSPVPPGLGRVRPPAAVHRRWRVRVRLPQWTMARPRDVYSFVSWSSCRSAPHVGMPCGHAVCWVVLINQRASREKRHNLVGSSQAIGVVCAPRDLDRCGCSRGCQCRRRRGGGGCGCRVAGTRGRRMHVGKLRQRGAALKQPHVVDRFSPPCSARACVCACVHACAG